MGQRTWILQGLALLAALLFVAVVILWVGASPLQVARSMWSGAFGTEAQFGRVLATLAPLSLCCCGLVLTFVAGLYNLGIEGQITIGAIAATFLLRLEDGRLPPTLAITLALGAGILGGAGWGWLAGILNVFGRVNEIFAGLGLNFVAQGWVLYLIFGPWKRPGVASMSGTELLEPSLWLPTWGRSEASPVALFLALLALGLTVMVVRNTRFGLQLRAVGKNPLAAFRLGIPSTQRLLMAFGCCGGLAGLAGALQVLALFHRLIPNISSNLGFLALLVVMLAGFNPLLILPIAFFFSSLNIGSLQLPLSLQLESSLAGVIQGSLVLFVLLAQGISRRYRFGPSKGSV
ncbi:ABC transporter permease [Synechococcus sp. Nb3U1]|uniref:ABC transporter permease n=1 Tax=Synechococcus sp. Nb3U1 TaxID=1914529 RepID=UPI001F3A38A6|nr:ABC transporter permease [Synechococcus sp. Nb3U1]MCF2971522.1 ABC transporter permease [Synechococcus sp. Nb3U1]